ncbi:MAG TPA: pyrroloquinoline quinone biosynthesis protein PqqE [Streptosporangiaceae bacterium]|nr:pyrroloquinoline quinone biosynthesis protein PqqE [Streptosporangiaceae bacterium]
MADPARDSAAGLTAQCRPALGCGVRLVHDEARQRDALLYPEGVLLLNETAGAVLSRCDGTRTVAGITTELASLYAGAVASDVLTLLNGLLARRLITVGPMVGLRRLGVPQVAPAAPGHRQAPVPLGLVAELTYRCPLQCPYCSNPLDLAAYRKELTTEQWCRVLDEARELGVLQVHLTGGEPLARRDLVELVAHAHRLGMYTGLVTSGVPLTQERFGALAEAGLDHVQLSVQDASPAAADLIAGVRAHERKLAAAAMVTGHGLPLTVNVVLHRANIGHVPVLVDLADQLGAIRLELANTQYYGWAQRNWAALLPTRAEVEAAERDAQAARARLGSRMEIVYVLADYYEDRPKPCVYGWGVRQLIVAPNGDALPCPAAGQLPGLGMVNVRNESLSDIWYASPAFNRFRGTDWMPEPCRSCPRKETDFGGCRCQAYQLTGDPAATDPACALSPHHGLITSLLTSTPADAWQPRVMPARSKTSADNG